MGPRIKAHNEEAEPFLEKILGGLRLRRIKKHLPKDSKLEVLDIGCGYHGKELCKLRLYMSKGVGIDLSVCDEKKYDNVSLIKANAEKKLPFKDKQFDIVVSLANIEHLNYPQKALNEIYRVLKPGGALLLTTPSKYAKPILEFLASKLKLLSEAEMKDHKNYYIKNELIEMSNKAGFTKIDHKYFQLFMNNYLNAKK